MLRTYLHENILSHVYMQQMTGKWINGKGNSIYGTQYLLLSNIHVTMFESPFPFFENKQQETAKRPDLQQNIFGQIVTSDGALGPYFINCHIWFRFCSSVFVIRQFSLYLYNSGLHETDSCFVNIDQNTWYTDVNWLYYVMHLWLSKS